MNNFFNPVWGIVSNKFSLYQLNSINAGNPCKSSPVVIKANQNATRLLRNRLDINALVTTSGGNFNREYVDNLIILPLILIMSKDGSNKSEKKKYNQILLDLGITAKNTHNKFISNICLNKKFRNQQKDELVNLLKSLSEEQRLAMVKAIWESCFLIASAYQETPGEDISFNEYTNLEALGRWIGWPDKQTESKITNIVKQSQSDLESTSSTAPLKKNLHTSWSDTFSPDRFEEAYKLCDNYHTIMSKLWRAGQNHLSNTGTANGLVAVDDIIIDQGVAILPESWSSTDTFCIGDLHGDIDTLEAIIRQTDFNSNPKIKLVFLGDYGDRGQGTMAVWMRLFDLLTNNKERIVLLKGNHEDVIKVQTNGTKGETFSTKWCRPRCSHAETYFALGYILQGNWGWIEEILNVLPSMAIFSDGLLAVHGGNLPRWHTEDGWSLTDEKKAAITVNSLADLRNSDVQYLMRWANPVDKEECNLTWQDYPNEPRLYTCHQDFLNFTQKTGIKRIIHGHTHPYDGYESLYNGKVTAVHSSRNTSGTGTPCFAQFQPDDTPGKVSITQLDSKSL